MKTLADILWFLMPAFDVISYFILGICILGLFLLSLDAICRGFIICVKEIIHAQEVQ